MFRPVPPKAAAVSQSDAGPSGAVAGADSPLGQLGASGSAGQIGQNMDVASTSALPSADRQSMISKLMADKWALMSCYASLLTLVRTSPPVLV